MREKLIAHVVRKDDGSWAEPQSLADHLEGTAGLAAQFAAKFASGRWGKAAGLAHDAGKGRERWQQYLIRKSGYDDEAHLEGKPGKAPHAIHGAVLVEKLYGKGMGRILAYCIAGHHAGLPDWSSASGTGRASLQYQQSQCQGIEEIDERVIRLIKEAKPERPPWKFNNGLDVSLWIRMLYSSLVDADFLDTEAYMDKGRSALRGDYCSIGQLLSRFHQYIGRLNEEAEETEVNAIRRSIQDKCIAAASSRQGIFSLTVPTGGGKTLSSLAFALEHAVLHDLDRIIYVIPYTSIIEQNADVFKKAIGTDQVIEHHSNLDENDSTPKGRLAAENWDAPLIVTTSVQFFESLFAAKSSRCRKLHNITRSVVVLDEAQLMPADFLTPILSTMQLLVDRYLVSFVISTATQPAFNERQVDGRLFTGLKGVTEIMGDEDKVLSLYHSLERYNVEFPADFHKRSTWEDIAEDLRQYEQVLCVVSDRKSCRELHSLMPRGTYHLSALMCGQHRSEIIAVIKERLRKKEAVRVISTQLVEAGVDLDFPVVYRAFAGLDSIAQAGGRCNREGKLPDKGKVVVFMPPRQAPLGILRKAAETTASLLGITPADRLQPGMFGRYFSELYWRVNSLDSKNIVSLLDLTENDKRECGIDFRTAAERFRIIDEATRGVLVPYGEGQVLIEQLRIDGPGRGLLRRLQRYTVNIYDHEFGQLLRRGAILEVSPGVFALTSDADYSPDVGLMVQPFFDPDKFVL